MKQQNVVAAALGAAVIFAASAFLAVSSRGVSAESHYKPTKGVAPLPVVVQSETRSIVRRGSEQFQVVSVCASGPIPGYLNMGNLNSLGGQHWHAVATVGTFTALNCGLGFNLLLERDI